MSARPTAASTRAHQLLSAAPDMGVRAAATLPPGAKAAHRVAATRALLRRLAGAAPDVPLTAGQLAGVAKLIGAKRQLVAWAWKHGVTPSIRERWAATLGQP